MKQKLLSVLLALALIGAVPLAPAFAGEVEQPSPGEGVVAVTSDEGVVATTPDEGESVSEVAITPDEEEVTEAESDSTDSSGISELQSAEGIIPYSSDTVRLFETKAAGAAEIALQTQEAGRLIVTNKWNSAIVVTRGQTGITVAANASTTLAVSQNETITVSESIDDTTFRSWNSSYDASPPVYLCPFVSGVPCAITDMPPMSAFTTDSGGTIAGDRFFSHFNGDSTSKLNSGPGGSLTSLPAGSFNTTGIKFVGNGFFDGFNANGLLASLPAGSFDISGITTAGSDFFGSFNYRGALTSLPTGSFDTSKITTAMGFGFFGYFNCSGALTSLPQDSFDNSGIETVGASFFDSFNLGGDLASLPASFRLPQTLNHVEEAYCINLFADSALTTGNRQVPLYFAAAATDAFTGTDITPASPEAGMTVYVNGSSAPEPPLPVIANFVPWNGTGPATARIDADLEKFVRLTLNGQVVDRAHYTLASGSTIITLSEAYLKTLPNGTHVFTAEFTDGSATLPLTVDTQAAGTGGNNLPTTGDSNTPLVLLAALVLVAAGGGVLLLARRRSRSD
ncbi:MAG: LPXTG cell wall anchor domain-containing protein [Coriobacteriales bacterium]|jgi:LPXTG-motif cell wall-anchored protein|nr:LPXTG cell wall anchor domain-containing protein [Coriobacteriales bacterium]